MSYDVEVREVGPRHLAAARGRGDRSNYLARLFALLDEVWRFLKANPEVRHLGLNVFAYGYERDKDPPCAEGSFAIEAGVLVDAAFLGAGIVVCSATPGGRAAVTEHLGPYEKLAEAHAAVREWCAANGRVLAGPNWEIYGHWHEDPAQLRTEVFYLLQ